MKAPCMVEGGEHAAERAGAGGVEIGEDRQLPAFLEKHGYGPVAVIPRLR